eukprot:g75195.t1
MCDELLARMTGTFKQPTALSEEEVKQKDQEHKAWLQEEDKREQEKKDKQAATPDQPAAQRATNQAQQTQLDKHCFLRLLLCLQHLLYPLSLCCFCLLDFGQLFLVFLFVCIPGLSLVFQLEKAKETEWKAKEAAEKAKEAAEKALEVERRKAQELLEAERKMQQQQLAQLQAELERLRAANPAELAQEARNGNLQRVKDLLAQGVSPDSKDLVSAREGEEAGRAADIQTSKELCSV